MNRVTSLLRPTRDRAARALVVLGCVLAVLALISTWVREQALNTHVFVDTSSAIIADPAVQAATASFLSDQLASSPATTAAVRGALPPKLAPLAGPVTGLLGDTAQKAARRALVAGVFQKAWRKATRLSHQQFLAVVDGRTIAGRGIILDLRPLLGLLAERVGLGPGVVAKLPRDRGIITVLKPHEVKQIRRGAKLLRSLAWWTSILALLALAGGVAVARDRRRALSVAGSGLLLTGLAVLVVRRLGISVAVSSLTKGGAGTGAALGTLHIATSLLAHLAATVALLGALLALGAWLVGPATRAVTVRSRVRPWLVRHRGPAHAINAILVLVLVAIGLLPWSTNFLADMLYLGGGALLIEALVRGEVIAPPPVAAPAT